MANAQIFIEIMEDAISNANKMDAAIEKRINELALEDVKRVIMFF